MQLRRLRRGSGRPPYTGQHAVVLGCRVEGLRVCSVVLSVCTIICYRCSCCTMYSLMIFWLCRIVLGFTGLWGFVRARRASGVQANRLQGFRVSCLMGRRKPFGLSKGSGVFGGLGFRSFRFWDG